MQLPNSFDQRLEANNVNSYSYDKIPFHTGKKQTTLDAFWTFPKLSGDSSSIPERISPSAKKTSNASVVINLLPDVETYISVRQISQSQQLEIAKISPHFKNSANHENKTLEINTREKTTTKETTIWASPKKFHAVSNLKCETCNVMDLPLVEVIINGDVIKQCLSCRERKKRKSKSTGKKRKNKKTSEESDSDREYYKKDYEVEDIQDKRIVDGKVEYYVKWVGWPESSNTWQSRKDLKNSKELISRFEQKLKESAKNSVAAYLDDYGRWVDATLCKRKRKTSKSPALFQIQFESETLEVKEHRVQSFLDPGDCILGANVMALFPTKENTWTSFYYPARIVAMSSEKAIVEFLDNEDGLVDTFYNFPFEKIIARRCINCGEDSVKIQYKEDRCPSCAVYRSKYGLDRSENIRCLETQCQFQKPMQPKNWPLELPYYESMSCSCLRKNILPKHWEVIEKHKNIWDIEIQSHLKKKPPAEIKRLPTTHPAYQRDVSEFGFFATGKIVSGDFLGEVVGKWKYRQSLKDQSRYLVKVNVDDVNGIDFQLDIDAESCGNEMRFINSVAPGCSFEQNAEMKTVWSDGFLSVYVYATKDIEPGEEIILDYGDEYFEEETPEQIPTCHVYVGHPYKIREKRKK